MSSKVLASAFVAFGAAFLGGCGRSKAAPSGRQVYLDYGCAACHGMSGDGRGMQSRAMTPPPTNFRDVASYRHGADSGSLRRAILLGIREESSRMPSFEHLAPEELDALVSYLSSLQTAHNE